MLEELVRCVVSLEVSKALSKYKKDNEKGPLYWVLFPQLDPPLKCIYKELNRRKDTKVSRVLEKCL